VKTPPYGRKGYADDQFYVPEVVTLVNGNKYLLYHTNSLRSDRLKENNWDAFNIREIDKSVTGAFLVLPSELGFDQGTGPRDKIRSKEYFSAIDDVLTVQELYIRLCNMAKDYLDSTAIGHEVEASASTEEEPSAFKAVFDGNLDFISDDGSLSMNEGAWNDYVGRKFEDFFAAVMDNEDNLNAYKKNANGSFYHYDFYKAVMEYIGIRRSGLREVSATTDIPKLPNNGSPKTDVLLRATTSRGDRIATFSLKSTSNRVVSVHDYTAEAFSEVLDPSNKRLRILLLEYQSTGNARDMPTGDAEALEKELKPYHEKLNKWVFTGEGAPGVKREQCADYLVAHNKKTDGVVIHDARKYAEMIERNNAIKGAFGTKFSWTYPSGSRGKRIQLKADVFG